MAEVYSDRILYVQERWRRSETLVTAGGLLEWLLLSLVIQVLLDAAKLPSSTKWLARIAAPVGTLALSGGLFGLAFKLEFRFLLYLGALAMLCSLILTGVGLLRNLGSAGTARVLH